MESKPFKKRELTPLEEAAINLILSGKVTLEKSSPVQVDVFGRKNKCTDLKKSKKKHQ